MKILYLITEADLGGAQKYVLDLATNFKGVIASGSEGNWLSEQANSLGLEYHRLKFLRRRINPIMDLAAFAEIFLLVKKIKPQIVHVNSSKAGIIGSLAGKLAGAKVVFTAHGLVFNEPRPRLVNLFFIWLEKFASLFRDRIITVSEFDKKSAMSEHISNTNKFAVIYHGLSPQIFLEKLQARQQLGLPQDKLVIGTIANFFFTKGLDVLIGAATHVKKDALYVIIGDGPERHHLETSLRERNLKDKFLFIGQKKVATKFLKAFDVFVLPSRKEGLPYTLIEALQAHLPIIATAVGGNPEILGENGYLVPPSNPTVLSLMIENLIDQKNLREIDGNKIDQQLTKFSHVRMIEQTRKIYELLM